MKKIFLLLLLLPFVGVAQVQTDAAIITQINNTIRGKTFNAKNHADAFKTIVDSKVSLSVVGFNFMTTPNTGSPFSDVIIIRGRLQFENFSKSGQTYTSLNLSNSADPSSTDNGDVWANASVLKAKLNGSVLTFASLSADQIFSNSQRFQSASLGVLNPLNTFSYIFSGSAITANRTVTLPLLTSGDTFVFENFTQTLTNKTFTSPVINTQISGTVTSGGNITTTNFLVGATATQTLTNKTLTSPIINTPRLGTTSTTGYVWTATDALGNGSWQAGGGGGGITNGAANNELMKSNGTNAVPSGLFSSIAGNIDLGGSSISGDRTISAVSSSTNSSISIIPKGATGLVGVQGQIVSYTNGLNNSGLFAYAIGAGSFSTPDSYVSIFDTGITAGKNTTSTQAFTISGSVGVGVRPAGLDLVLKAGNGFNSGATNGGHLFLTYGAKNGAGLDGNIGLFSTSVGNWQGMERGLYISNRLSAPTAGIANGVALHATDVNSNSELFLTTESGAEVNISGLLTPVLLSGTSLTLSELHRNKIIYCTSGSAVTITVPAGLPLGYNCIIMQDGAGTVTLNVSAVTLKGKSATTGNGDTIALTLYKATDNYLGR